MTQLVYHFTSTAHLPWIIDAGELRAGANKVGRFPDPDFLWATTCEAGDDTATGNRNDAGFRSGDTIHRVRDSVAMSERNFRRVTGKIVRQPKARLRRSKP
jgi:hypothetical protein